MDYLEPLAEPRFDQHAPAWHPETYAPKPFRTDSARGAGLYCAMDRPWTAWRPGDFHRIAFHLDAPDALFWFGRDVLFLMTAAAAVARVNQHLAILGRTPIGALADLVAADSFDPAGYGWALQTWAAGIPDMPRELPRSIADLRVT